MCQSTASKCVSKISKEMQAILCHKFIVIKPEQSVKCMNSFLTYFIHICKNCDTYNISVIGCVDGIHIDLQKSSDDENMFFNRKGFHSSCSVK